MVHKVEAQIAWNWADCREAHWSIPVTYVYYLASRWNQDKRRKLLDLGCGIGRHSLFFARRCFLVSAIDISRYGVERTKEVVQKNNLIVNLQIGDMHSLPYQSNSFDCLFSYHTLHHTDQNGMEQTISELKRVLKKDGEAYITLLSNRNPKSELGSHYKLDEHTIVPLTGNEIGIPHFHVDENKLLQLLKDFSILEIEHVENIWANGRSSHWHVLICNQ